MGLDRSIVLSLVRIRSPVPMRAGHRAPVNADTDCTANSPIVSIVHQIDGARFEGQYVYGMGAMNFSRRRGCLAIEEVETVSP